MSNWRCVRDSGGTRVLVQKVGYDFHVYAMVALGGTWRGGVMVPLCDDGRPYTEQASRIMDDWLAALGLPGTTHVHRLRGDVRTNWWVPGLGCLRPWLEDDQVFLYVDACPSGHAARQAALALAARLNYGLTHLLAKEATPC